MTQTLSDLSEIPLDNCARWTMSKSNNFLSEGGDWIISDLDIVRVRVTQILSELPPPPPGYRKFPTGTFPDCGIGRLG